MSSSSVRFKLSNGKIISEVLLTLQLPIPWSKLKTSLAFASLSAGIVKQSVLTEYILTPASAKRSCAFINLKL